MYPSYANLCTHNILCYWRERLLKHAENEKVQPQAAPTKQCGQQAYTIAAFSSKRHNRAVIYPFSAFLYRRLFPFALTKPARGGKVPFLGHGAGRQRIQKREGNTWGRDLVTSGSPSGEDIIKYVFTEALQNTWQTPSMGIVR